MMLFLGIFMLTAVASSTLAQYNYEKPLKHGGYIYSPPKLPFNEAPPFKTFSTLQASSTSAPKLVDKTPAQGYIYSKPNVSFTLPTQIKSSTTSKPLSTKEAPIHVPNLVGYEYAHPAISFTYPSIHSNTTATLVPSQLPQANGYSYPRSSSLGLKDTVSKPSTSLPKSSGYTYTRPLIPFISPTIEESHSSTVPTPQSTIRYSYTTPKPSADFNLAPSISAIPPTIGYTYTRPAVPFTIPPRVAKDKPTQLPKFKGYSYTVPKVPLILPNLSPKFKDNLNTKPGIVLKTQAKVYTEISTDRTVSKISPTPSTGYSYSPPSVPFTIPPKNTHTRPSNEQITQPPSSFSKPITLPEAYTASRKKVNGYVYSRPDIPFKTPNSSVITISSSSVIQPAAPSKSLPKSDGYSYTPPNVTFTIPSSTPAVNHSPTKALGYSYTPPKVPFTTPQKVLITSQKQTKPTANSNYLGSPEKGYSYPKPGIPFAF